MSKPNDFKYVILHSIHICLCIGVDYWHLFPPFWGPSPFRWAPYRVN
jgi:hypothetical protein